MKKLFFIFLAALFLAPFTHAANITPESTPCDSYTTLYQEGSRLTIDRFCLLRSCIAENKSASFYFKYSSTHKDRMSLSLRNFQEGLFEFSNGVNISVASNQTRSIDLDSNGFYDEQITYEFDKPELSQICFRVYELKESSKYKVTTQNEITQTVSNKSSNNATNTTFVTNNTKSKSNVNMTNSLNQTSQNATKLNVTAQINETFLSNDSANVPATTPTEKNNNDSAEKPAEANNLMPTTSLPESSKSNELKGQNEIIEGTTDAKTAEKLAQAQAQNTSTSSTSLKRIIIGTTIALIVIALILAIYLIYERKRNVTFKVDINKDIGTINIEKKE